MSTARHFIPSLVKKYLMALSGLVLVGFVVGHMLGNLQFFGPPEVINAYAYHLKHLPGEMITLWAIRLFLIAAVGLHIAMAILLYRENKQARPESYDGQKFNEASYAARTMPMTGLILLFFILFHLAQFTVRVVPEDYTDTIATSAIEVHGETVQFFDVYAMMVAGFADPIVSLFYIVAVGLLCAHVSHGFASMFQSIGIRNENWSKLLSPAAIFIGVVLFIGFASIPASVMVFGHGKDYLEERREAWSAAGAIEAYEVGETAAAE